MDTKKLIRQQKRQYRKGQQIIIDSFYADHFTWYADTYGQKLVAYIMNVAIGIFMLIPYQEMNAEGMWMLGLFGFMGYMGAMYYSLSYIQFREEGKMTHVYDKLKYLPVSLNQIRCFRLKMHTRFCLRSFAVFFLEQMLVGPIGHQELCWGNIWYPVVIGFVCPMCAGLSMWWMR